MPSVLTEPLPADVIAAAQRGDTLEAIALLRTRTGMGLVEARAAIEAWAEGQEPVFDSGAGAVAPRASSVAALWVLVIAACAGLATYFFLPTFR